MSIRDDYRHSGFFAIRTPLLPFAAWSDWPAGSGAAGAAAAGAENAELRPILDGDLETLRARLRELLRDPVLLDALFVASPSLEQSLHHWLEAPASDKGRNAERAIVKYFARMAGRCTPFGLFSGCSVGEIGSETRLQLAPRAAYQRHTRPDMDFLAALVDGLNRDPELRRELRFRPNSSLYRIGDRVQYAEARLQGRARSYYLVTATADEALMTALEGAAAGATLEEIAAALAEPPEIELEEAIAYVNELVDAQVLVPDLAPAVTGPESLDDLLHQLHGKRSAAAVCDKLEQLRASLRALDEAGPGAAPSRYREVAESLRGLPADADIARLFQVDLTKPAVQMQLDPVVIEDLLNGVQVLLDLFAQDTKDGLEDFRKAFRERYEDREVPLVEALDEEVGIGFRASSAPGTETSPLLVGIQFPMRVGERTVPVNATTVLLQRKLFETLRAGLDEMVLEDADLEPLRTTPRGSPPDAFEIMAAVLAPEPGAPEGAHRPLFVHSMSGPSGARLLGRFCQADAQLTAHVVRHLAEEEALQPDATFFEIVHLPEGRIGNVIARPVLRGYELAFLGRSSAPAERQLAITDLSVSLQGERIVLRSRSLGREVIPRLTTAHNTELRTVGAYRFLAALQLQSTIGGLTWSWGTLGQLPFLPRVRYRNTVLSRRTWNVPAKEIQEFSKGDDVERFRKVQAWRQTRGLPRHLGLVDGDNVLPVDLDNAASVDAFVDAVARRPQLTLREMFPGPKQLAAEGPEGRFCHEIIVPFVRKVATPAPQRPAVAAVLAGPTVARLRPPGSDWLYLKIYSGEATGDRILRDVVSPLVDRVFADGLASKWFFIRYADPARHLRVRFHGEPAALAARVLPAAESVLRPFVDNGLVWKVQIDTYDREMRRYGGAWGMELCESAFHADSDAVRDILAGLTGDDSADERWRLTLDGIDRLMDDFGFDLPRKFALMQTCAKSAAQEFGITGGYKDLVLGKYRKERKPVEQLLDRAAANGGDPRPGVAALRRRTERLQPFATELLALAAAGKLECPLHQIVQSLVHMYTNRMLRGSSRAQETILYQFLDRHYDSQLARLGVKGKQRDAIRLET